MKYMAIDNKTSLNKLKRKFPYWWDLNIYRWCEHGCKYCYAMYSHDYLDDWNFFENVYYKENIIKHLEKELSSSKWNREIVNIWWVCDSYQPIEKELKIMSEVLKLMIKYKTPIIISSKSDLILRDYDLIDELSKITYVNVAQTIITADENLREKLEPWAVEISKRFEVLSRFSKTNASIGLHIMPIIPYITDSFENLDKIYSLASNSHVSYVLPWTLYLLGKTKNYFHWFLESTFPVEYNKLIELYKDADQKKQYKNKLYTMINEIKSRYQITSSYSKFIKEKLR